MKIDTLDLLKARAGCYKSISLAADYVFIALDMIALCQQEIDQLQAERKEDAKIIAGLTARAGNAEIKFEQLQAENKRMRDKVEKFKCFIWKLYFPKGGE